MKNQFIAALLCSIFFTVACKKDKDSVDDSGGVYVAGMQRDSLTGNDRACYWKNGSITFSTVPAGNPNYYANAIAVVGSDVYTTGFEIQTSQWKCHVWKNGLHQYGLGDAYSYGNAIAVEGDDVYVGGAQYETSLHTAFIWKNENALPPLGTSSNSARVLGSCTSGSDVYSVGNIDNVGKLWKNGAELPMSNTTGAVFKAVAVSGNDVYIAANTDVRTIRYWKNGSFTDITVPAGREIYASGITVENNDIYVSGWESTGTVLIAKYWKNGNEVVLGDGIKNSYTGGIAVKNGKVYVAGNQVAANSSFPYYATLWEDGVAKVIGARNSQATAIVVN